MVKKIMLSLLFIYIMVISMPAVSQETDGFMARKKYGDNVALMLHKNKFKELEELAELIRRTHARFPEGAWKLHIYYKALTLKNCSESSWQKREKKLELWKTEFPSSITLRMVQAQFYTDYAQDSRGEGWSNEVTKEGWKLFKSHTASAKKILMDSKSLSDKCPRWYYLMQVVALSEGWSREKYDALFDEAVSKHPDYYYYYLNKAIYLLERWHGKKGDWQKFADETVAKTKQKKGYALYARIYWYMSSSFFLKEEIFAKGNADWKKMKKGFQDIEKFFPDSSWNLNAFCHFACLAGDQKTARELFDRIDKKPTFSVWKSQMEYISYKEWAYREISTWTKIFDFIFKYFE